MDNQNPSEKSWILIKEHNNYVKGHGFVSDLLGNTINGLTKSEQGPYNSFKTEFEEDPSLGLYEIYNIKIPKGKLKVYGRYVPEYEI